MEKRLEPFLPTVEEVNALSLEEFRNWVNEAVFEIAKRDERRNPMFHLRQRVLTILSKEMPEEEKEARILNEIKRTLNHL